MSEVIAGSLLKRPVSILGTKPPGCMEEAENFENKVIPFLDKCLLTGISRVQCLPSGSLPGLSFPARRVSSHPCIHAGEKGAVLGRSEPAGS